MKVFDLHCDTMTLIKNKALNLDNDQTAVSLAKAAAAKTEAYVQCFAIFVKSDESEEAEKEWAEHYEWFKNQMMMYVDRIEQAMTYDDIVRITAEGKSVAVLTAENASSLGGRLESISEMRQKGCLIASLTWNGRNALAGGAHKQEYGLSGFGREAVAEMERCGMIVDVSHLSDRGISDFLKIAHRPFVATHSNARKVCGNMRNLPDEYIKEIIKYRGLIGINYYEQFLRSLDKTADVTKKSVSIAAGLEDIANHIEHILMLGGEDVLALGSDYDGADIPDIISGIDKIGVLYTYLVERFGNTLTEKIFFDNAANFFRKNFR